MTKTVMCTAAIATISVLLFAVLAFDAEAKTFTDRLDTKGLGIIYSQDSAAVDSFVSVEQIQDSNDVDIIYIVTTDPDDTAVLSGGFCTGSGDMFKNMSLKKPSLTFNTADLDCGFKLGSDGIISLNFDAHDDKPNKKQVHKIRCIDKGDFEACKKTQGSTIGVDADVEGTVFGISFVDGTGEISKVNNKVTMWTNP